MMNIVSEILSFGRRQKDMKISAYLVYPNSDLIECRALITEDEEWSYVPIVNRFWYITKIHKLNRKRVVFLPYKYHKSLDLSRKLNPMTVKALASLQYMRRWNKIKMDVIETSIDLNVFDNDLSPSISVDTFKIFRTKILEFVQEMPQRKFILSMIISLLVGVIIGIFLKAGFL